MDVDLRNLYYGRFLVEHIYGTGYNCPVIETTKPAINEVIDPSITIKYTIPVKLSFDISNK
ncbi:hypothetical protein RhiirA5_408577 [Rhizophagus irregularis]|uniref:Uncharacterized protein n=2 Tax=Rhizophagus irregularis TaxID=588596 RepID=A0A2I1E203_9GLOM|nr:hypothetical protein GLOIN_2v1766074 [Rhizophagus irregularis DAOM 181602=DAOM 197198]PKC15138.1 hypothetical protein RhiirA5_408577 [Rhizophagus irregularis]PKC73850.1 hypothetical protein RhiirA1_450694 [Rhizophagus irregularis]PKY16158.1 hypothetical protein RhiirB3_428486 [Rhizophagus irregularis]POG79026.1 hypothetical protein GLOIN_2v1766074 [Rhizophagus irregularis DAOM 181602=DAOM 197198]|eukprot:XP_025185892.1 hypothetical protein GLOIN_2v1766074 [Rhizophagus irregularis DAOM 181602=DAOM 197198]